MVEKQKVPELLPRKLHWFRWEAALTWLSGMVLLVLVYYMGGVLVDTDVADISVGAGVGIGLGLLVVAWVVYDLMWQSPVACHGATPVIFDGHVFAVSAGHATCVRLSDGEAMWREHIGDTNYSSPIVADGKIFAVVKHSLWMLDTNTNSMQRLDEADLRILPCTSPAIADAKLYVRHHQHIACYDLRS